MYVNAKTRDIRRKTITHLIQKARRNPAAYEHFDTKYYTGGITLYRPRCFWHEYKAGKRVSR